MLFIFTRWNLEVSPNDAEEVDSADEAVAKKVMEDYLIYVLV